MPVRFTATAVPGTVEPAELRTYLDQEFRRVASSQETERSFARLLMSAGNVVANDTTETPIIGYAESEVFGRLEADPVAGTITLPSGAGVVRMTMWVSLEQVTSTRNFTTQIKLGTNGAWAAAIAASGYLPQQGSDVRLGMAATVVRRVAGGEVFRLGIILDGATPATFAVDNTTFEIVYEKTRG